MKEYIPHFKLTPKQLEENNFKFYDSYYSYRFPVYRSKTNKKDVLLWGILYLDLDNPTTHVQVVDSNNNLYASYFNRNYGKNTVVLDIDKKVSAQMNEFVKTNILVVKRKKH